MQVSPRPLAVFYSDFLPGNPARPGTVPKLQRWAVHSPYLRRKVDEGRRRERERERKKVDLNAVRIRLVTTILAFSFPTADTHSVEAW
jgi:hypothetical protein